MLGEVLLNILCMCFREEFTIKAPVVVIPLSLCLGNLIQVAVFSLYPLPL